jgi:methanesulfonate monooxygenase small subunit
MSTSAAEQARTLVSLSCLLLDEEKFDRYLELFSAPSRYRITAYSPDLRKDQAWLDLDRKELETLLSNLPRHVRLPGRFLRHPNGFIVQEEEGSKELLVTTSLLVAHTDVDGVSRLFAAGRYRDRIEWVAGEARLKEREVRLDTRQFGPGSHVPI